MADPPAEVAVNPVAAPSMDPARFSADGLTIDDPAGLLADLGAAPGLRPGIVKLAIQHAPSGVIQDPAGVAVGSPLRPKDTGAGAASRSIYDAFPDLEPIPSIAPGSAIFNASTGPGRRVLHTHSPQLAGDPAQPAARETVLVALANAYANAMIAFARRAPELGDDGRLLNLVPVSAGVFAGRFSNRRPGWTGSHLDPTYTLTAVYLAAGALTARGEAVPGCDMYYFKAEIGADAEALVKVLAG